MNVKLGSDIFQAGDYVHTRCRPRYQLQLELPEAGSSRAARSHGTFNFRKNCLFCGDILSTQPRKQKDIHSVSNPAFGNTLKAVIIKRDYDGWATEVNIL